MQKCRNAEFPECRDPGMQDSRNAEFPECRVPGNVEFPECRNAGMQEGVSEYLRNSVCEVFASKIWGVPVFFRGNSKR